MAEKSNDNNLKQAILFIFVRMTENLNVQSDPDFQSQDTNEAIGGGERM